MAASDLGNYQFGILPPVQFETLDSENNHSSPGFQRPFGTLGASETVFLNVLSLWHYELVRGYTENGDHVPVFNQFDLAIDIIPESLAFADIPQCNGASVESTSRHEF
ncbi:hypothetical protein HD806DRAFT_550661 [Xylariaceae sp. AK1471]|nr:hypothetical protein HD806DRAFT_550661 [Xylariaceae sp. AK1471]